MEHNDWAPPPEPESLFDEIVSVEEGCIVWLEPGHGWVEHDEKTWDQACFHDDSSHTVRGHGYLWDVESHEVLSICIEEDGESEEDAYLPVIDSEDSPAFAQVFRAETEVLEERLARRRAENDLDRTYAVRASLPFVQYAIAKLERTLGADVTPVTASKPLRPLQRPTKPLATYRSDASREWWAGVKVALDREVKELSREEPILGSRVEKIDQHLERKGLKLLDRVRSLLPSLRLVKQEQIVELLTQLREAGYEEIARSLYREWLGPTKASLLARTSRDKRPPPAPIKELLERSLPTLKEAGKVSALEKVRLEAMRERRELAARALSNLTE